MNEAKEKLEEVASLAENINQSLLGEKAENLDEMLESEMSTMDKAIEEAANRIQVRTEKHKDLRFSERYILLGYADAI